MYIFRKWDFNFHDFSHGLESPNHLQNITLGEAYNDYIVNHLHYIPPLPGQI